MLFVIFFLLLLVMPLYSSTLHPKQKENTAFMPLPPKPSLHVNTKTIPLPTGFGRIPATSLVALLLAHLRRRSQCRSTPTLSAILHPKHLEPGVLTEKSALLQSQRIIRKLRTAQHSRIARIHLATLVLITPLHGLLTLGNWRHRCLRTPKAEEAQTIRATALLRRVAMAGHVATGGSGLTSG
jgi:hypothetical protein